VTALLWLGVGLLGGVGALGRFLLDAAVSLRLGRQFPVGTLAVNASGAFWAATYTGKLDSETFVIFLRNFMKGRRTKVFLVVDGHPAHKANVVKNYIAQMRGRLELYFLPPYAPDLNPDEFVWNYMKNTGVSKKPLKQNESLRERVEQDLADISQDEILVASFFLAESVVYTAD